MASAWGSSWGSSWGGSWGSVGAATPATTTSASRIRAGGTSYYHKTISRIEREKAAAKARKRIAKRIKEATPEPTPYLAMWDAQISASLAEQPTTAVPGEQSSLLAREWAEQIARIDQMIWSAMVQAERQAEEDAAVLLLAM